MRGKLELELKVKAGKGWRGEIVVPGDKSISHRAALLGALARGTTVAENFLAGADCLSTLECLRRLGVRWDLSPDGRLTVTGSGPEGLEEPEDILDAGNSGTTMRLLLGILAGQSFFSVLTGDRSLRRRPMARVTWPLREMGATINGRQDGSVAPLAVGPFRGKSLAAREHRLQVASAQVKSALLLAGLFARGETIVSEPAQSRDHTERMLAIFGASLEKDGLNVKITGGDTLKAPREKIRVPGDLSAAAFFLVAGSIVPDSELVIRNVGVNPTRTGIIDVLLSMGGRITVENEGVTGGEPVADLRVKSSDLRGVEIGGDMIPRLIDEIPVLAVAAACAEGRTVIGGAAEARVKESDRLLAVAGELSKLGAKIQDCEDGLVIEGGRPLQGTACSSHDDHRIAMALAVAALKAGGETRIKDAGCIRVSYPSFPDQLGRFQN